MNAKELITEQAEDVRAEIEAIQQAAGVGATGWQVLVAAGKRSAQLRSTLREYLNYSSIDGRTEREPLRNKLRELLGNR